MRRASTLTRRSQDPRELPAYSLIEAAHYIRVPSATLRSWVRGRHYPTDTGQKFFRPLITLPDADSPALSFVNLVEAHVLAAIRKDHGIQLRKVRRALRYVERNLGTKHPLADQRFETDGLDLFIDQYGDLINASQEGQLALRALLEARLKRIVRDPAGMAIKLYPFTRRESPDQPKYIVIDPKISFGRPVLVGTGISTAVVAERYKAGDSIAALADDYARPTEEIEEAIRCELQLDAA